MNKVRVTFRRDYNKHDVWTEVCDNEAQAIRLSCMYRATIIKVEQI